jgi:hypothetical protein
VSEHEDARLEAVLRSALARHPRPRVSPGFATRVLARVAEREQQARARPRAARVLLATYWSAAATACAFILASNPLPDWGISLLLALAVALTPLAYAATLWPRQARAWLRAALGPLAPGPQA